MKLEALKSNQGQIFPHLSRFKEFCLVGGTALALQIGHRISVDFDLFTEKELSTGLFAKAKRVFKGYRVSSSLKLPAQLTLKVDDVRIDFMKDKFRFILNPLEFKKVKIAQIPEIAAMKAFTLNYRGSNKDYIDLYFILKGKYSSLKQIADIGGKKYGDEFNFRLFLEQLLYLEDVRRESIEFLCREVSDEEIKSFFEKEIKKIKL